MCDHVDKDRAIDPDHFALTQDNVTPTHSMSCADMWVERESATHHHANKKQKEYFYFIIHAGGKYVDCRVEREDTRQKWITNLTSAAAAAAVATSSGNQVFTRFFGRDLLHKFNGASTCESSKTLRHAEKTLWTYTCPYT